MNQLLNIGRYLFPLSFLMYVGLHAAKPDVGAAFVPDYIPFPLFFNYLTMCCILAFIVSALLGKYDKLAYSLMALYILLMAVLVHIPRSMGYELGTDAALTQMLSMTGDTAANLVREKELETVNIFRNIMVAGALMGFARYVARDNRIVG